MLMVSDEDINDKGWIVGTMDIDPGVGTTLRAVLLICSGDLNEDGSVNGLDLGIVLANWSIPATAPGCGGTTPCVADIDCDGLVGGINLGIVLGQWDRGGCRPDCPSTEQSMMASTEDILTPALLAYIEALVAEGEIDAAVQFLAAFVNPSTQ